MAAVAAYKPFPCFIYRTVKSLFKKNQKKTKQKNQKPQKNPSS